MNRDNIEHGWIGTEDSGGYGEEKYTCDWCGEHIFDGDEYYDFDGVKVCAECIDRCKRYA